MFWQRFLWVKWGSTRDTRPYDMEPSRYWAFSTQTWSRNGFRDPQRRWLRWCQVFQFKKSAINSIVLSWLSGYETTLSWESNHTHTISYINTLCDIYIYTVYIINMYHRKTYILVVCSHPGVEHAGDLEVQQMQRLELLSRDTGDPGASAWNVTEKPAD
jgi:hypothetical protein